MDDLVQFLRARLDEEAVSERATRADDPVPAHAEHVRLRPLKDAYVKRWMLDQYAKVAHQESYDDSFNAGRATGLGDIVRKFAAVYADHPDYREEWRSTNS
ncbi:DUF6221 family protein [Streptomyces sp. NPDC090054]|uniref:DUF6221 family protein n=1 Tax=Streptomyces sp. NPDC090054 TaxID=3365933 RepID=UPI0037F56959